MKIDITPELLDSGLDPLLLLRAAYGLGPDANEKDLHPIVRALGFNQSTGPTLNFSMTIKPMTRRGRNKYRPLIIIVGGGGTGSHVVPNILQFVYSQHKKDNEKMPEIVIIDGDHVEEKNLVRQRFSESDLGLNKATALAQRYSAAFGMSIASIEEYITSEKDLSKLVESYRPVFIIGAVDNHYARMFIYDFFMKTSNPVYWIDAGNESWNGQAVLGVRNVNKTLGRVDWTKANVGEDPNMVPFPCFFDRFPEDIEAGLLPPVKDENACVMRAVVDPQTIQANMMSAQCATALFIQAYSGDIRVSMISFDALSGNTVGRWITKENLIEDTSQMTQARAEAVRVLNSSKNANHTKLALVIKDKEGELL